MKKALLNLTVIISSISFLAIGAFFIHQNMQNDEKEKSFVIENGLSVLKPKKEQDLLKPIPTITLGNATPKPTSKQAIIKEAKVAPNPSPTSTTKKTIVKVVAKTTPPPEPQKLTCATAGMDIKRGHPNYRSYLDTNNNGIACESPDKCPNGDYTASRWDKKCGTKPAPVVKKTTQVRPITVASQPPKTNPVVKNAPNLTLYANWGVQTTAGAANLNAYQAKIDRGGWWLCADCKIIGAHNYSGGNSIFSLKVGNTVRINGVAAGLYRVSSINFVGANVVEVPAFIYNSDMTLQTCIGNTFDRRMVGLTKID